MATWLALAIAACAPSSVPAPTSPAVPTPPASASTASEFSRLRDAICVAASDDIASINATMDAMAPEALGAAFRQIADRIRAAQSALDALPAPAGLADFIAGDNARRAARIEAVEQMAIAVIDDPGAVDAIDAKLTELNLESERAEDALALKHCA